MEKITYKTGYKYCLNEEYFVNLKMRFPAIFADYIELKSTFLTIKKGYAWDGPSGPTIDTKTFMRGSLVHDVFYQLMREGTLDEEFWRPYADKLLKKFCIEDGMNKFRAWYVYLFVRAFGKKYAIKETNNIQSAP